MSQTLWYIHLLAHGLKERYENPIYTYINASLYQSYVTMRQTYGCAKNNNLQVFSAYVKEFVVNTGSVTSREGFLVAQWNTIRLLQYNNNIKY